MSFHFPKLQPMWSGCMQLIHSGSLHPCKISDTSLSFIDLTPSDPTCVRSTLEYACRHGITAVVSLDQQLLWIAYMLIECQTLESALCQLFLILGGFHTEMIFIRSIGSLRAGLGLQEVISQVYSEGSVEQMPSGYSVSRAVPSHLMVDIVLNTIVTPHYVECTYPTDLSKYCNGSNFPRY